MTEMHTPRQKQTFSNSLACESYTAFYYVLILIMMASQASGAGLGAPPKAELATPASKNPTLDQQFKGFTRDFYQSLPGIGQAHSQMGQKCNDTTCPLTYFKKEYITESKNGKPNMTEGLKRWCIESDNRQGSDRNYNRVCYVCGEILYGKANLKVAYAAAGTPTKFWLDPRSSEIEHVADMGMAAPFGILAEEKHPNLNKSFMEYEYLWAHNRCNKTKNDRSLLYIEKGVFKTYIFLCLKLQFKVLTWLQKHEVQVVEGKRWANTLIGHMGGDSYTIYTAHYENRDKKTESDEAIQEALKVPGVENNIKDNNKLVKYIGVFCKKLNEGVWDGTNICIPNGVGDERALYNPNQGSLNNDGEWLIDLNAKRVVFASKTITGVKRPRPDTNLQQFIDFCKDPSINKINKDLFKNPIAVGKNANTNNINNIVGLGTVFSATLIGSIKTNLFIKSGVPLYVLEKIRNQFEGDTVPRWITNAYNSIINLEEEIVNLTQDGGVVEVPVGFNKDMIESQSQIPDNQDDYLERQGGAVKKALDLGAVSEDGDDGASS